MPKNLLTAATVRTTSAGLFDATIISLTVTLTLSLHDEASS